jgi:hypothetical protein
MLLLLIHIMSTWVMPLIDQLTPSKAYLHPKVENSGDLNHMANQAPWVQETQLTQTPETLIATQPGATRLVPKLPDSPVSIKKIEREFKVPKWI